MVVQLEMKNIHKVSFLIIQNFQQVIDYIFVQSGSHSH